MRSHGRGNIPCKILIDRGRRILRQQSDAFLDRRTWRIWTTKHGNRAGILFDYHFGPSADASQQPGKIADCFCL